MIIIKPGITALELKRVLRKLNRNDTVQIGDNVVMKTSSGYAVRAIWDEDDFMTDYHAYIDGWKESWIVNRARELNFITD